MRHRILTAVTAAAGITAAAVALQVGTATAGHSNDLLEATLDGRSEVATGAEDRRIVGDPNGKGEAYVFGIDGDDATLCYVLTVEGIAELDLAPGNGRAAHIHEGPAGANGPVVANLAWPEDGDAADCLTEEEPGKGLEPGQVAEILENPENYYVNVHNTEFPGGAIRGQLAAQD